MFKTLREIHSENGNLSWGRVASSFSLLATIGWVTKVIFHTHAIPDLGGPSLFVTGPYVANRTATALQAFSNNPAVVTQTGQQPAPPEMHPTPPPSPPPPPPPPPPIVVVGPAGPAGATGATGARGATGNSGNGHPTNTEPVQSAEGLQVVTAPAIVVPPPPMEPPKE